MAALDVAQGATRLVGGERVALQPRKPLRDRPLRRGRPARDVVVPGAPAVRVYFDVVDELGPEELVDRNAERLGLDVPERLVDRAECREHDRSAALRPKGIVVDFLPEVAREGGVGPDERRCERRQHRRRGGAAVAVCDGRLAVADESVFRL